MKEAPERIWVKPVCGAKEDDDYYLCSPKYLDGKEIAYVRTDVANARRDAARAEGFRIGAEDMRELAAAAVGMRRGIAKAAGWAVIDIDKAMCADIANAIRDLPLPDPEPEGAV